MWRLMHPHCVQDQDTEELVHDIDDPDMAVTAPVLHGPGLTALVVARPANRIPRLPLFARNPFIMLTIDGN